MGPTPRTHFRVTAVCRLITWTAPDYRNGRLPRSLNVSATPSRRP